MSDPEPAGVTSLRIIFVINLLGGLTSLGLAIWPGLLESCLFNFPLVCLTLPGLGLWLLVLLGVLVWDLLGPSPWPNRRRGWGIASLVILLGTVGLLWQHVPQRVVFLAYQSEFEALLASMPTTERGGEVLDRRIGPYSLDRYGIDARGGGYFRTATAPDGIGPDRLSFGFAYQPNTEGTPFGNAGYRLRRLVGAWYVFTVSDDS